MALKPCVLGALRDFWQFSCATLVALEALEGKGKLCGGLKASKFMKIIKSSYKTLKHTKMHAVFRYHFGDKHMIPRPKSCELASPLPADPLGSSGV